MEGATSSRQTAGAALRAPSAEKRLPACEVRGSGCERAYNRTGVGGGGHEGKEVRRDQTQKQASVRGEGGTHVCVHMCLCVCVCVGGEAERRRLRVRSDTGQATRLRREREGFRHREFTTGTTARTHTNTVTHSHVCRRLSLTGVREGRAHRNEATQERHRTLAPRRKRKSHREKTPARRRTRGAGQPTLVVNELAMKAKGQGSRRLPQHAGARVRHAVTSEERDACSPGAHREQTNNVVRVVQRLCCAAPPQRVRHRSSICGWDADWTPARTTRDGGGRGTSMAAGCTRRTHASSRLRTDLHGPGAHRRRGMGGAGKSASRSRGGKPGTSVHRAPRSAHAWPTCGSPPRPRAPRPGWALSGPPSSRPSPPAGASTPSGWRGRPRRCRHRCGPTESAGSSAG